MLLSVTIMKGSYPIMATRKTSAPSKAMVTAKGKRHAQPAASPAQLDLDFTSKAARNRTAAPSTSKGSVKRPKPTNKGEP